MSARAHIFTALFVAAGACGFPDVKYEEAGTGMDSSSTNDGSMSFPDSSVTDKWDIPEVLGEKPPLMDSGDMCDKDGDKSKATGGTCGPADAAVGTFDCDDTDNRALPGQQYLTDLPVAPTYGDWNCNGLLEKQYAIEGLDCTSLLTLSGCAGKQGFTTTGVMCGQPAPFVTCANNGVNCKNTMMEMRKQGCK